MEHAKGARIEKGTARNEGLVDCEGGDHRRGTRRNRSDAGLDSWTVKINRLVHGGIVGGALVDDLFLYVVSVHEEPVLQQIDAQFCCFGESH